MPKPANILPIKQYQQTMPMETLLTPGECAKRLGVSVRTLMRWADAEMFKVFRVESITRIYPDSFNEFMERHTGGKNDNQ